jgi:tetraacyldisaccharide 4'-kinase
MRPPEHPALRWPLRFLATLYAAVVVTRNRYYDRGEAACRPAVPVISVGNLTVGGTGKTPTVGWLAARLRESGHSPAVVSRGYGGRAGRGPLIVSRGTGPLCGPETSGDEPFLLATALDTVPVVVGSDRCAGAALAVELGARVVILDDGFQHRRIARDLDIVLLDATSPFGNGYLLPAGPLREPRSSLNRAGLVLITRCDGSTAVDEIERQIRRDNPSAPILRSRHRRLGFRNASGHSVDAPRRAVVFCGLGNPAAFRADVEAESVEVVEFETVRDHHRYLPAELAGLRARAIALNAALVTTEKDRVRLPTDDGNDDPPLLTLAIEAAPLDPDALLDAVGRVLGGNGPS